MNKKKLYIALGALIIIAVICLTQSSRTNVSPGAGERVTAKKPLEDISELVGDRQQHEKNIVRVPVKRKGRKPAKTGHNEPVYQEASLLNMKAQGTGSGLFVILELQHGSLKVGSSISIPLKALAKSASFANYLAVIYDLDGEVIQRVPVKLDKQRNVLPQEVKRTLDSGCECEGDEHSFNGSMRLRKFSQRPGALELYRLSRPYISSETDESFDAVLEKTKLTLVDSIDL